MNIEQKYVGGRSQADSMPDRPEVFRQHTGVTRYHIHLLSPLRTGLIEAEPHDAEVLAVEDELAGVELELLIGAQDFLLPLRIVDWNTTTRTTQSELKVNRNGLHDIEEDERKYHNSDSCTTSFI